MRLYKRISSNFLNIIKKLTFLIILILLDIIYNTGYFEFTSYSSYSLSFRDLWDIIFIYVYWLPINYYITSNSLLFRCYNIKEKPYFKNYFDEHVEVFLENNLNDLIINLIDENFRVNCWLHYSSIYLEDEINNWLKKFSLIIFIFFFFYYINLYIYKYIIISFLGEWLILFCLIYLSIFWFYEYYIKLIFRNQLINIMFNIYILIIVIFMLYIYISQFYNINFINQLLIINNFNWFIKFILFGLTFFIIFFLYNFSKEKKKLEFIFLILISLLGMFLMISSNDLFFLYLSIEIMSLPLYILLGTKKSNIGVESSIKYFISGSIVSIFMLMAISLIYGFFGTTNYFELKDLLILFYDKLNIEIFYILFSFVFLIITFFFKLGLVPFHFWVTDLYEGASLIVIFFISLIPKLAIFIAFFQLFVIIFGNLTLIHHYIYEIFVLLGFISVLVGSWGGLKEIKIMRILGQSSIINMGFFFIILLSAQFEGNLIFIYIYIIYSFLVIQIFNILIFLKDKVKNIIHLTGLFNYSFIFFIIISLCILSLAAIPPLSGFLIKFFIFENMINLRFFSSVFFLLLHSVITTIFYIRLLYYIWTNIHWSNFFFLPLSLIESIFMIFLFIINLLLIFLQDPLLMIFTKIIIF